MSRADYDALASRYDRDDMARVISGTPDQIEFALADSAFPDLNLPDVSRVVIAGMGGSALPADVVEDVFAGDLTAPLHVSRQYTVPGALDSSTLVIATSFSGSTEETLAAFDQVITTDASVVVIAAGGALAERAEQHARPFIRIPKEREPAGFQPRCALGYFATYITRVLDSAGVLPDGCRTLASVIPFLRQADIRGPAEDMASWVEHRVPLVYTDQSHERSIARIAKIKLNENSKRPAFYNVFPEANHNEMIGMSGHFGEYALVYIKDPSSHQRIHRRYEVTRDLYLKRGLSHVDFASWELPGITTIERVFAGLVFADWWSYALALLGGVNPTPVDLVEEFKVLLRD